MSNILCVENLPSHFGPAQVQRLVRPYGAVRCTSVASDPDMLRRATGMALVEMPTARSARAVVHGLDGATYRGATLRVRPAVGADFRRVQWMCRWAHPKTAGVRADQRPLVYNRRERLPSRGLSAAVAQRLVQRTHNP